MSGDVPEQKEILNLSKSDIEDYPELTVTEIKTDFEKTWNAADLVKKVKEKRPRGRPPKVIVNNATEENIGKLPVPEEDDRKVRTTLPNVSGKCCTVDDLPFLEKMKLALGILSVKLVEFLTGKPLINDISKENLDIWGSSSIIGLSFISTLSFLMYQLGKRNGKNYILNEIQGDMDDIDDGEIVLTTEIDNE